ncbi:hypothetical protein EVAR_90932_1 [Eumeta japonica]|uniref:Uncharacterized protein n=1 Tax=Eumeta variegata TaxID=151549 RepID=A0A4C1SQA3_EUMVA|nr:hypothetical protein EVAR_90932_1 [Eumeta japonica]
MEPFSPDKMEQNFKSRTSYTCVDLFAPSSFVKTERFTILLQNAVPIIQETICMYVENSPPDSLANSEATHPANST